MASWAQPALTSTSGPVKQVICIGPLIHERQVTAGPFSSLAKILQSFCGASTALCNKWKESVLDNWTDGEGTPLLSGEASEPISQCSEPFLHL